METEDAVTIAISCAAFGLAIANFWRAQVLAQRQNRASLSADQIKWANTTMDLYGGIDKLCFSPGNVQDDKKLLSHIIADFSVEIDKGKFLYPNVLTGHGDDKLEAYRGERQKILDVLMLTHDELKLDFQRSEASIFLRRSTYVDHRKRFVSLVQSLAEVRERIRHAGRKH